MAALDAHAAPTSLGDNSAVTKQGLEHSVVTTIGDVQVSTVARGD
jgi:hypothetical protein